MSTRGLAINFLAGFLLRQAELIQALQVQPELRSCAEEMRERNAVSPVIERWALHDARHAVRWYAKLPRQFGGAHLQRFQFLRKCSPG